MLLCYHIILCNYTKTVYNNEPLVTNHWPTIPYRYNSMYINTNTSYVQYIQWRVA